MKAKLENLIAKVLRIAGLVVVCAALSSHSPAANAQSLQPGDEEWYMDHEYVFDGGNWVWTGICRIFPDPNNRIDWVQINMKDYSQPVLRVNASLPGWSVITFPNGMIAAVSLRGSYFGVFASTGTVLWSSNGSWRTTAEYSADLANSQGPHYKTVGSVDPEPVDKIAAGCETLRINTGGWCQLR